MRLWAFLGPAAEQLAGICKMKAAFISSYFDQAPLSQIHRQFKNPGDGTPISVRDDADMLQPLVTPQVLH